VLDELRVEIAPKIQFVAYCINGSSMCLPKLELRSRCVARTGTVHKNARGGSLTDFLDYLRPRGRV
jgi:hypothetical protein